MQEQVGAIAGAMGVVVAPLVSAAARTVPAVGRPRVDAGAGAAPAGTTSLLTAPPAVPVVTGSGRHLMLVALATGVVLGVLGARVGADAALPAYLVFGAVAVVLASIDLRHHRLPDVLTLPSYAVGGVLLGLAALLGSDTGSLSRAVLGAIATGALFAVMHLAVPYGLGAGDVKYAGVIGLHAAWFGWATLVLAVVAGFVVGGLVSVALLAVRRADLGTRLPFGPSLVAGAVLAIACGEATASSWLGV